MLQSSPSETLRLRTVVGRVLGRAQPPRAALAVPVAAGSELLGALVVGAHEPWHEHAEDLLRSVAHQIAVALKKAELIESLSEEHSARELFAASADPARATYLWTASSCTTPNLSRSFALTSAPSCCSSASVNLRS